MSSWRRKAERAIEIRDVRAHARNAALGGQSESAMPKEYRGNMNELQWLNMYRAVRESMMVRRDGRVTATPCPCGCDKWIVEPLFYSVDASLSKDQADELVRRWNHFEETVS